MEKFNRNYKLTVQSLEGDFVTIGLPFTVEFDIQRNILSSVNTSSIRIFGLNPDTRNKIRKDKSDFDVNRRVNLKCGYGDNLSTVFDGNLFQAWSTRPNNVVVTQMECMDAGYAAANANMAFSAQKDTTERDVIKNMIKSMADYNVSLGSIGSFENQLTRGNTFSGNSFEALKEYRSQQGGFFVDNGIANVLNDDEVLEGPIQLINADTGLLGTPQLHGTFINFDILFSPELLIGQQIQLTSKLNPSFNAIYKILSIAHRGTISESVCGDAITTIGAYFGVASFKEVRRGE